MAVSNQKVIVTEATETYHSDPNCSDGRETVGWCSASEAHRSRLKACTKCSATLARSLKQELGSIPSGAKRSLGLPKLQGTKPEMWGTADADNEDVGFHYGSPEDVKDPRFAARSAADWGTGSYDQDPAEFLGGPTDDDNDWRGGGSQYY